MGRKRGAYAAVPERTKKTFCAVPAAIPRVSQHLIILSQLILGVRPDLNAAAADHEDG
jgi:hypothetical protein